jgi:hypothetical protein
MITEDITVVTLIEFPPILEYAKFKGRILMPLAEDYFLAYELQKKLRERGEPRSFPDLLIAAMCINRGEVLLTKDENFLEISNISELKVRIQ